MRQTRHSLNLISGDRAVIDFQCPMPAAVENVTVNVKTRENEFKREKESGDRCVVCALINLGGPMFSKLSAELHHGGI